MGIFKKLINSLKKTKDGIASKLASLFKSGKLGDEFFEELCDILISSDVSVLTAENIIENLKQKAKKEKLRDEEYVREVLREILLEEIDIDYDKIEFPCAMLITGVNGTGKTTSVGKLANYFAEKGKTVTVVAADTFRAAAADQLSVWADRAKVKIIRQTEGCDAASVVFDAIASAKAKKTDVLLIDTAGRLHVKSNLMEELKKINRTVEREYQGNYYKLIVLDCTTGQNALTQVESFDEAVGLDGIILTKLDGTAKGGFIISLCSEYGIPVMYAGVGEKLDDIEEFDCKEFVEGIL